MAADTLNEGPSSPLTESSDSELSILSRSPTPPLELSRSFAQQRAYVSPSSSGPSSAKTTPAPEDMPSPPSSNDENPRPSKRRKMAEPKERTTEYLDLSTTEIHQDELPQLQRLLNVLHKKRKIVVIAGAGISVSAGIPDFRSSTGLFNTLKRSTSSNRPARISSMPLYTRMTRPHLPFMTWCAHFHSTPSRQSPLPSTIFSQLSLKKGA
ncbi:hypothetical protein P3342_003498 [Pyrenophora teres f. teres]|nr:hypothetical protein P3342_003498 [Pyrenophora teres f. teres]